MPAIAVVVVVVVDIHGPLDDTHDFPHHDRVGHAAHLLERPVNPESQGSIAANVLCALLLSVPLIWLRSAPIPVVLVLVAGAVLNQEIATNTDEMFTTILTLIYLGYALARHQDGRERWIALGVLSLALTISEAGFGSGDVGFVLFVLAGGAIGGTLVRNRAALTR